MVDELLERRARRANVRLLAATNRDLAGEVEAKRFREDLYYRINVMTLELPPLRERRGDIRLLVQHFLGPGWEIEPAALDAMESYHWPGNVRQLINAIDRAKILCEGETIRLQDLPRHNSSLQQALGHRVADRPRTAQRLHPSPRPCRSQAPALSAHRHFSSPQPGRA